MNALGPPDDPLSQFALSVFWVNGLLMRDGDIVTRSIGQSSARWQVLGRLGYQSQTVAHMAREMGHARQSVQRVADVLAKDGLLISKPNPADRRAPLLELTPQGAQVLAAIYALSHERTQYLLTKLDPAQLIAVADALAQIAQILEANELRPPIPYDTEEQ